VSAALVCAHLAALLKKQGKTLGDRLDEISRQYGVYSSEQVSATYPGTTGAEKIRRIMSNLREGTPWNIGTAKVAAVRDYERAITTMAGGSTTPLESPGSNVLAFDLADGARIIARPSGTEPKIKYYFDVRTMLTSGESLDDARARGAKEVAALKQAFLALVDAAAR
jgi:phosphomannomutase